MNGIKTLNPEAAATAIARRRPMSTSSPTTRSASRSAVSASRIPSQDERYNAWGYADATPTSNLVLGGAKPYVQSNLLKRYGAVATLEWQPSDNFHSTFDALYSHFQETQHLRGHRVPARLMARNADGSHDPRSHQRFTIVDGFDTDDDVHQRPRGSAQRLQPAARRENISLGWNNVYQAQRQADASSSMPAGRTPSAPTSCSRPIPAPAITRAAPATRSTVTPEQGRHLYDRADARLHRYQHLQAHRSAGLGL